MSTSYDSETHVCNVSDDHFTNAFGRVLTVVSGNIIVFLRWVPLMFTVDVFLRLHV